MPETQSIKWKDSPTPRSVESVRKEAGHENKEYNYCNENMQIGKKLNQYLGVECG